MKSVGESALKRRYMYTRKKKYISPQILAS